MIASKVKQSDPEFNVKSTTQYKGLKFQRIEKMRRS